MIRATTFRFLAAFLFSAFTFAFCVFSQTGEASKSSEFTSFKFAEIGEMPRESWEKELAKFADETKNYRESTAHLIVYAEINTPRTSIDPIRSQYKEFLKQYLGDSVWVSVWPGGYRNKFAAELWIVSKNDRYSPKETPDEPFKPEQLGEIGDVSNKEFEKLFAEFWNKLAEEPSSQGYIVNYGSDKEIARREKILTGFITFRKSDRSRITLVRGGNRYPGLTILWRVPMGAANPAI